MTIEELKALRSSLINRNKRQKKYVTVTPYLERENNQRFLVNLYTCLDYTEEEISTKIDNEGAIKFLIDHLCETNDELLRSVPCSISYFIDARARTEKDFKGSKGLEKEDFLENVFAITLTTKTGSTGDVTTKRTFIIDMDRFLEELEATPLNANFGFKTCSASALISRIVHGGFKASPRLEVESGYYLDIKDKSL